MRPIVVLLLLASAPAAAQQARPETPEIATSGQGEVVLAPDHARLSLGIEVHAATAALASSQVGARVQQARQAIRAKGFLLDSIRVTAFDVSPNYQFERERKLIDYGGHATVQLTVRPLDKLGTVIDTALASGVNDISGIEFQSDSSDAARNRALGMAVDKARRDAEALARASGGKLGRLLSLSTEGQAMRLERADVAMRAMGPGAPPVERDVVVRVGVQARWEFIAP